MPDVVDFLLHQHEEVRSLFKEVQSATGEEKKDAFNCLVNLLAVHETAEEMIVYPVVRSSGDEGDRLADARIQEESEAKDALSDLERIGPDSPEFAARFGVFEQMVDSHARNEEQEVFPFLRQTQEPDKLRSMAEAVEKAEKVAPTHPHPHGPESAIGNMVIGPFVAVADKVRDKLRS
ncbi:MAG TPA: hemerythrin domain-containing protein [Acidimicrobiales bacterium]|jgi:hemerythrin superfamily protein